MTTMLQTYNKSTNQRYKADIIIETCMAHNLSFACNGPEKESDELYNIVVWYNEFTADILMDMDKTIDK